jgi:predicted dehydrogenase
VKLALLGFGYWGEKMARAAVKAGHVLRWVVDPAWHRLAVAATEHRGAFIGLDSSRAAVTDPKVDAVVIATPPATHCTLAIHALRAGKHVLVTKPMATSSIDAAAMILAARAVRCVLMVDHTWLYDDRVESFAATHPMVKRYVSTRTNIDPRGGDGIWDLLPHDLSILDALGYALDRCDMRATNSGDVTLLELDDFHRIVVGNGASARVRYLSILTEDGCFYVGEQAPAVEPLVREFEHFRAVVERGEKCRTPGDQGLRVVRCIERAAKAIAEGRKVA